MLFDKNKLLFTGDVKCRCTMCVLAVRVATGLVLLARSLTCNVLVTYTHTPRGAGLSVVAEQRDCTRRTKWLSIRRTRSRSGLVAEARGITASVLEAILSTRERLWLATAAYGRLDLFVTVNENPHCSFYSEILLLCREDKQTFIFQKY